MADFKVKTEVLTGTAENFNGIKGTLRQYSDNVQNVANALNFKVAATGALRTKIKTIAENVNSCALKTTSMADTSKKVASHYENAERRLMFGSLITDFDLADISQKGSKNKIWDNIFKIVSKFGIIGGGLDVFYQFSKLFTGDDPTKAVLKGIKSVNSLAGSICTFVTEPSWLKAFGLRKNIKSAKEVVIDDLSSYVDFSTGAKAGKSVTKWAGVALTGAINAYDYSKKYKNGEMSLGDAAASTAIKTGLDIAIDVGAKAAAAAAVGAVVATGVISAPGVVVAAATVVVGTGIVMGADAITKWVSNGKYDSLSAAATDGLIKGGHALGNFAKASGAKLKKTASTAWRGVCGFFGGGNQTAYAGGGGGAW